MNIKCSKFAYRKKIDPLPIVPIKKDSSIKNRMMLPGLVIFSLIVLFTLNLTFREESENPASQLQEKTVVLNRPVENIESPNNVDVFSDSKALKNILRQIQKKAGKYDIDVSLKDLKSAYNRGRHMISVPNLTVGLARKIGLPLPSTSEMTSDEFEQKKRYKCAYSGMKWQYFDRLPKTDQGIFECWAQLKNYGGGTIVGNEIWFESGFRKVWVSRKWDAEQKRWVQFTKKEKEIARHYSIEEKAGRALEKMNDYNYWRDEEESQALLVLHLSKLKGLNKKLNAFGEEKLKHLEGARQYRNFNKTDRQILDVLRDIRSIKSRIKSAIILAFNGQIQKVGLLELLKEEGLRV